MGYVDVVVVDVAQQPVVSVAVGLSAVGDDLDGAADRREVLEQAGCLVGVAPRRRWRVGNFGGVDAEQADSAERPAGQVLDAQGVSVDDGRHPDPGGLALDWVRTRGGAGEGCGDAAGGQRGDCSGGQPDEGLHRATPSCARSPAMGTARSWARAPGDR